MALSVWIKGVNKTSLLKAGSLTINRGADNRNDCSLSCSLPLRQLGMATGRISVKTCKSRTAPRCCLAALSKRLILKN